MKSKRQLMSIQEMRKVRGGIAIQPAAVFGRPIWYYSKFTPHRFIENARSMGYDVEQIETA